MGDKLVHTKRRNQIKYRSKMYSHGGGGGQVLCIASLMHRRERQGEIERRGREREREKGKERESGELNLHLSACRK